MLERRSEVKIGGWLDISRDQITLSGRTCPKPGSASSVTSRLVELLVSVISGHSESSVCIAASRRLTCACSVCRSAKRGGENSHPSGSYIMLLVRASPHPRNLLQTVTVSGYVCARNSMPPLIRPNFSEADTKCRRTRRRPGNRSRWLVSLDRRYSHRRRRLVRASLN